MLRFTPRSATADVMSGSDCAESFAWQFRADNLARARNARQFTILEKRAFARVASLGQENRKDYFMRKSTAPLTQQIDDSLPLWRRSVTPQRSAFIFTHAKQLAAIMAALGILFGLWFGIATYHAPRPSYPYYDTQKPVPTWSEPAPIEGNRDRGGEYK